MSRKGKTYEEIYGKEKAKIMKLKIKNSLEKHVRTKEHCENISKAKTLENHCKWKGGVRSTYCKRARKIMKEKFELKATPILKGKVAKRFYRDVSNTQISTEQREFLNKCVRELLNEV